MQFQTVEGITHEQGERRRSPRYPVCINAKVRVLGIPLVLCEISDYCQGGMFLKIMSPFDAFEKLRQHSKKSAELLFDLPSKFENETFRIEVIIVRVSDVGLGVAFKTPPQDALRALQLNAQTPSRKQPEMSTVHNSHSDLASFKRNCNSAVGDTVSAMIRQFYQHIDKGLLTAAEQADNDSIRNDYFDAICEISKQRNTIENDFIAAILHRINNLSMPDSEEENSKDNQSIEKLSIVDKDEFDDWLNISNGVVKLQTAHEQPLIDLEEKLSIIANREIDKASNPLDPARFFEVFSDEIKQLKFCPGVNREIYKIFERAVNDHIGELYGFVKGELSTLQSIQHSTSQKPDPTINTNAVADTGTATDPSPPVASTLDNEDDQADNLSNLFSNLVSLEKRTANTHSANAPADAAQGNSRNRDSIADFSSREILSSLKQLSKNPIETNESLDANLLKALKSEPSPQCEMSAAEQTKLDIAEKFFDNLTYQIGQPTATHPILKQVQLPFMKLALDDPKFLGSSNHPAHRIITLLDRLNPALNEQGKIANSKLEENLAEINQKLTESSNNPELFHEINAKLEKLAKPITQARSINIERLKESLENRQKTEKAKFQVDKLLDNLLFDHSVPKVLLALLNAGWKKILVRCYAQENDESSSFQKRFNIVKTLFSWLIDENPSNNLPNGEIPTTLNFIDEELTPVCLDKELRDRILAELSACLIGSGNPKVRKTAAVTRFNQRQYDPKKWDQEPIPTALKEWYTLVKELSVGNWLAFDIEDGLKESLNLVWIGEFPRNLVFVNRLGLKKLELSPLELADYFRDGQATNIDNLDVPLYERTTNAMLQEMHNKLLIQATHDEVTGLLNRKGFILQLENEFAKIKKIQRQDVLLYMETDQIKMVNSSCGLEAGDRLLNKFVDVIKSLSKDDNTFGRIGDESFAILLKNFLPSDARQFAKEILDAISQFKFTWEDNSYTLGVHIGMVKLNNQTASISGLLKKAVTTCVTAKSSDNNGIKFYQNDDKDVLMQEGILAWAGQIGKVLENDLMCLRCQLITPVKTSENTPPHYEILLGIKDECGKIVSPVEFIAAAEQCNRMRDVDMRVIQMLFDWIENNPDIFQEIDGFSINLSGQSINNKAFLEFLKQQVSNRNICAEKLTFEITETAAVGNLTQAQIFITQLKRYGCKFSLDDFGSGFSSYSYLKNLNVDYLKIDGVFVKDLAFSQTDFAMVKSMNDIAHSMGMETIAEYVENQSILNRLSEIGVDYAQGYLINKPFLLTELR